MVGALIIIFTIQQSQRELGEGRSYAVMWKKYKRRVLLAMSSQAFAQLVSFCHVYLYHAVMNMSFPEWNQR
jgi:hypothetical protein